jgi:hypothetical protein
MKMKKREVAALVVVAFVCANQVITADKSTAPATPRSPSAPVRTTAQDGIRAAGCEESRTLTQDIANKDGVYVVRATRPGATQTRYYYGSKSVTPEICDL